MNKIGGVCRGALWTMAIVSMIAGMSGCTRAFYRKAADREVNDVLAEKNKDPRWRIDQYHVYPDSRARFADTTNPDRPQMPADDEAVWKNSPHPQKPGPIAGVGNVWGTGYFEMIKAWDAENRAELLRTIPQEKVELGKTGSAKHPLQAYLNETVIANTNPFLLTLDQTIELGVINSPQYQSFREELYLAALPVTQQRFNFAYQWAATADWIREWAGPKTTGGPLNNWTGSSTIGFNKLFATGALLTTDFANTTAFNFAGAAQGLTSGSTVNLNLAQPLLQGGGKAVTLEPLTQAERNLYYSIRAYARFREQFNVAIALGASLPANLQTAAGASSTSGPISTLAALGIASTDVAGGFVGYLSTVYRECDLAADQKLAYDLQEFFKIIEAYQEGGFYSPLQVDQARSQMLGAQNTVLTDRQFVTNALDQFKLVLGLPANMPLILDDSPARPITHQLDQYYEVIADSAAANRRVEKVEKQELLTAKEMRIFLFDMFTNEAKNPLLIGTSFRTKVPDAWLAWREAKGKSFQDQMEKYTKQRRELLDLKTDQDLKREVFSQENQQKLAKADFEIDLGTLEKDLRQYDAEPWLKLPKQKARDAQIELARLVVLRAKGILVYARNERFDGVSERWPLAAPAPLGDVDLATADVNLAQELAVQASLQNRVDLMNTRAQVVDAWRQLAVTANALMGVATVQYTLQAQTAPGGQRPLAFNGDNTTQQINLNFQLPLNRVTQRNNYRTALINYQVARRTLMNFESSIAAQVRFDVRQLQLFAANYAIQKRLVHSLYKQVDNALDVIVAPTDPDALKGSATSVQANAAALTNQYLNAVNQLNGAQVRMFDIWLSLYATRMQLYLDLERLPLDLRGVWVDENSPAQALAKVREARKLDDTMNARNTNLNRGTVQPVSTTAPPARAYVVPAAATLGAPVFTPRVAP